MYGDIFLGNAAGKSNFYHSNPIFKSLGCLLFKEGNLKSLEKIKDLSKSLLVDYVMFFGFVGVFKIDF